MKNKIFSYPKTISFLLGCLTVAALPPYYLLPVLIVAFSGLILLIQNSPTKKKAFSIGYWFGFGYFACGLFWINNALMLDLTRLGWLIPLVFAGSGGFFGLFTALPALFARYFNSVYAKILALAAAWTLMEWLRSFILTGFPWNLLGTVWAYSDSAIQITSIVGTYGLSLLTITMAAIPATLFVHKNKSAAIICATAFFGIIIVIFAYGTYRLKSLPDNNFSELKVRIVQPAIPQQIKWQTELLEKNLQTYVDFSTQNDFDKTNLIIWGETANPFVFKFEPQYLPTVLQATPENGFLITGALDYTNDGEKWRPLNSMQILDRDGVVTSYNKSHLVPFGEYIPLRRFLPKSLKPVTNVIADFKAGEGTETIRLPQIPPFGALICYEIIFPAQVVNPNDRPEWLINLTNDGWYGESSGPYQHLVATRMRAVEEGLTIVRAANSGISALISKTGVVLSHLPLNVSGNLDIYLPAQLSVSTLYSQYHNQIVLILCMFYVIIAYMISRRNK